MRVRVLTERFYRTARTAPEPSQTHMAPHAVAVKYGLDGAPRASNSPYSTATCKGVAAKCSLFSLGLGWGKPNREHFAATQGGTSLACSLSPFHGRGNKADEQEHQQCPAQQSPAVFDEQLVNGAASLNRCDNIRESRSTHRLLGSLSR